MYTSSEVVIGFHGCDKQVADEVIKFNRNLSRSENSYDWLGHGIYFWEGSFERAMDWAESHSKVRKPAVVGAYIKLGNCIDLLDSFYLKRVLKIHSILQQESCQSGLPLPENSIHVDDISFVRTLDCRVITRMQQIQNEIIALDLGLDGIEGENQVKIQNDPNFYDTVRGMFPEGKPLYSGAGFRDKNHIQLCVVNPNAIIGYFNPKKYDPEFKRL